VLCVGRSLAWTWQWTSLQCGWRSHPVGRASLSTRGRSSLRWFYATATSTSLAAWHLRPRVESTALHRVIYQTIEFLCTDDLITVLVSLRKKACLYCCFSLDCCVDFVRRHLTCKLELASARTCLLVCLLVVCELNTLLLCHEGLSECHIFGISRLKHCRLHVLCKHELELDTLAVSEVSCGGCLCGCDFSEGSWYSHVHTFYHTAPIFQPNEK